MFVCCECCVLSGRGLCDELITRLEESYRLWCVVMCDIETSSIRRPWHALGCRAAAKKNLRESYEISYWNTKLDFENFPLHCVSLFDFRLTLCWCYKVIHKLLNKHLTIIIMESIRQVPNIFQDMQTCAVSLQHIFLLGSVLIFRRTEEQIIIRKPLGTYWFLC
jgi:hypothetical protein